MNTDLYTYCVTPSPDDGEYVGLWVEFPSLSWIADAPEQVLEGIHQSVNEVVADLQANGEPLPECVGASWPRAIG